MRVMTFGTFDDLHPGHLFLIGEAQKRGELIVVVARDANVLKFKGRLPIQSQDVRKAKIEELFPDAQVVLGHETDFMERINTMKPDLILLGYDQKLPPGMTEEDLGAPIERLPAFEPHVHKSSLRRPSA